LNRDDDAAGDVDAAIRSRNKDLPFRIDDEAEREKQTPLEHCICYGFDAFWAF
jgi:hypothetical protein